MRDAVIDVDVATPATRGFFGIQFRLTNEGANGEWVYLRQHKSGLPDAMQYTPILNTGANWQIYNGPGFTGAVDIPKDVWFHVRLEVAVVKARICKRSGAKRGGGGGDYFVPVVNRHSSRFTKAVIRDVYRGGTLIRDGARLMDLKTHTFAKLMERP